MEIFIVVIAFVFGLKDLFHACFILNAGMEDLIFEPR